MDTEDSKEAVVYAPLDPCKHHVSSTKVHPIFGEQKESIVNKKIVIFMKICGTTLLGFLYFKYAMSKIVITSDIERASSYILPVFLVGFILFQITHLFHRVDLFERGMVYKTLYSRREYNYSELYDIQLRYDDQFNLDERRHGLIWYIFAKRYYRYYAVSFAAGRGFKLSPKIFKNLDLKIEDLQRNLITTKVEGE